MTWTTCEQSTSVWWSILSWCDLASFSHGWVLVWTTRLSALLRDIYHWPPVILLMQTFILQLCTSLRSTSRSSLDFCRHSVFDYSNRLIGLQEAPTQIPRQLPAGDERAERTATFSAHKHPTGSAWIITPKWSAKARCAFKNC